jgi:predicted Zn-dependent peptidase
MPALADTAPRFDHRQLPSGIELAADLLPERQTVALNFRILTGLQDEPEALTGVSSIVERTLSKGTAAFDGRALADAFDAIGAQWGTASGRQTTMLRVVCLPEFVSRAVELAAEMVGRPTFPDEACQVAVQLAQEDLKQLEDDPGELVRVEIQRLTYGPHFGRHTGGTPESLARLTPEVIRAHWRSNFHRGRMQVTAAGPLDADALSEQVERHFGQLGRGERDGRRDADYVFTPGRSHRNKDLKQQYICMTLPGLPKADPRFAVEQVLIGVLSGGMSGRLFTEVREKQGLVYWVGAWHEQPRGRGVLCLGASTTPERCDKTYDTLRRELARLAEDLTDEEVARARNQIIAHMQTEDDLTRARASSLADDLFHFGRPIGPPARMADLQAVTLDAVRAYAAALPREQLCVATLGPRELA